MSKKNAILAAATQLFSNNGFKETSMAELTRITGAAGGTIFHHFKNKEDLFLQVLEDVRQTVTSSFNDHEKSHTYANGMQMLEGLISFYLDLAVGSRSQLLLLHRHFPYQMAATNPTCRNCLESVYNSLLDVFEAAISKGIEDGSIRDVNTRNTAMVIFAMVDGVARLNTYNIYHAESVFQDLLNSCRRTLDKEYSHARH